MQRLRKKGEPKQELRYDLTIENEMKTKASQVELRIIKAIDKQRELTPRG
jgi:hypothetical protein